MATVRVSGTGKGISFEEKKKVLIQRQQNGLFIQTDKPVYNPGQKGKRHTGGMRQKACETAAHICRGDLRVTGRPVGQGREEGLEG